MKVNNDFNLELRVFEIFCILLLSVLLWLLWRVEEGQQNVFVVYSGAPINDLAIKL